MNSKKNSGMNSKKHLKTGTPVKASENAVANIKSIPRKKI